MKRSLTRISLCLLTVLSFIGATTSISYAEAGNGIESDSFNLSVGFDLFAGVNTNLFYEDGDGVQGETNAAPLVSLVPSLTLTTINPRNIDLQANADVGFDFYFGDASITSQSSIKWNLGLGAHFKPKSALSFKLLGRVNRSNQPSNKQGEDNYSQNIFGAGAILGIHPGGRALQSFISYNFDLYRYDTLSDAEIFDGAFASTSLASLNKNSHTINGKIVYKFLPKTLAALSVDWRVISYAQRLRDIPNNAGTSTLKNIDSKPLRLRAGLNGLISEAISLRLFAGYGIGFYNGDEQPSGLLVDVELAYHFGVDRKSSLRAGYNRNFKDATLGSFFNSDRIHLGFAQNLLDDRLLFVLDAGVDFRDYILEFDGGNSATNKTGSFKIPKELSDIYVNLDADLRYQITDWLHAGVNYGLLVNATSSNVDIARELQGRNFIQHLFMLRAGIRY